MNSRILHENYHRRAKIQKKIITETNFTYRNAIEVIAPHLKSARKILDVGCGVGTLDFYLASKGLKVTGLDISKNAIRTAKANSKLLGLDKKISFFQMNFPQELPKGKYDIVIISEVLEHIKRDDKAVRAIRNLVKKKGDLIVSVPSKKAPLYRLGLLNDFDKRVGHLRRYLAHELVNILRSYSFEIVTVKKTEGIIRNFLFTNPTAGELIRFIKGPISDFVTFIDNLMIPLFGESQIYIIAQK